MCVLHSVDSYVGELHGVNLYCVCAAQCREVLCV